MFLHKVKILQTHLALVSPARAQTAAQTTSCPFTTSMPSSSTSWSIWPTICGRMDINTDLIQQKELNFHTTHPRPEHNSNCRAGGEGSRRRANFNSVINLELKLKTIFSVVSCHNHFLPIIGFITAGVPNLFFQQGLFKCISIRRWKWMKGF